ncbi:Hpt domain-containing protein [Methylopila musalis]|uniref:Hpt domain-containing protein n=1 Tax=Methylopila musalis TaxID=1134781 RepID=A0ABW3ZAM5_9HYPH
MPDQPPILTALSDDAVLQDLTLEPRLEGLSWDVPAEVFTDHVVLRPPNALKERAAQPAKRGDRSGLDAVSRAEHAMELLSAEFDGWMAAEIERLEAARKAYATQRDPANEAAFYRSAHDLRGQAATFGFPLVGEIADGLCQLMEALGPAAPQPHLDRHVEAMRALVREDVRGRHLPLAIEIVNSLVTLRADVLPKPPTA